MRRQREKTEHYVKVVKPTRERERRIKVNSLLTELAEMLADVPQSEGKDLTILKHGELLEVVVKHLRESHPQQSPSEDFAGFHAGYTHCMSVAFRFMSTSPGTDIEQGKNLMTRLSTILNMIQTPVRISVSPSISFYPSVSVHPSVAVTPISMISACTDSTSDTDSQPLDLSLKSPGSSDEDARSPR